LFSLFFTQAFGNQTKHLGSFGKWEAWVAPMDKGKYCYISSEPEKSEGKYTRRGNVYAMVAHRSDKKSPGVVNIESGYPFKAGSFVKITIDDTEVFKLFTEGQQAWASNESDDRKLVLAMKSGLKMLIEGVSTRGTKTLDTFSLSGFSRSYKKILSECKQ
tara:strand:+ start:444 stop:923 length:480 start_codon:yes stop_codon:yes gene_type:complete